MIENILNENIGDSKTLPVSSQSIALRFWTRFGYSCFHKGLLAVAERHACRDNVYHVKATMREQSFDLI